MAFITMCNHSYLLFPTVIKFIFLISYELLFLFWVLRYFFTFFVCGFWETKNLIAYPSLVFCSHYLFQKNYLELIFIGISTKRSLSNFLVRVLRCKFDFKYLMSLTVIVIDWTIVLESILRSWEWEKMWLASTFRTYGRLFELMCCLRYLWEPEWIPLRLLWTVKRTISGQNYAHSVMVCGVWRCECCKFTIGEALMPYVK